MEGWAREGRAPSVFTPLKKKVATHLHSFRKLRHATGASSVSRSMTRSPRVVSRRTDIFWGGVGVEGWKKKEGSENLAVSRHYFSLSRLLLSLSLSHARTPARVSAAPSPAHRTPTALVCVRAAWTHPSFFFLRPLFLVSG